MIKILHIITRLDMGGSAQNTLLTCLKLSRDFEMVLICGLTEESNMTVSEIETVGNQLEKALAHGVKIIRIPSLVRRISPAMDIIALCHLIKIFRTEKPTIVHTHTSKAGILGRVAAKITKTPSIVHTPHGHVFYGHFGPTLSWIFIRIEKLLSIFTHRLVALTEGERKDYMEISLCTTDKLLKIHSGVDVKKFEQTRVRPIEKKRSLGLAQNHLIVGFIGWLLPIKGPHHLLKAMKEIWQEHQDVSLVFVGKGNLDVELRAEALKIGTNGRVKFLGWRNDVDEILTLIDILVLPSLNEGMGRVLVEAMAAGKPIVASNVGGIPDLVKHNINGLLVPPGDEKALASGIKQLITDPKKSRLMGRRGRQLCHQFSIETMVDKIHKLYNELP